MAAEPLAAARAVADVARSHLLDPPGGADPVVRFTSPGEMSERFDRVIPIELPDRTPARTVDELSAAAELVVELSVQTSHPRFFNQNFAGPDPVAVAGDWLGAALNTTSATFEAAPVFTMIEAAVLRKLAAVAGYDAAAGGPPPGLFAPGGSTATLYALQLARHRRQPDLVTAGAGTDRHAIFVSTTGHYAAAKSAALLGIGIDGVVEVATDERGAMIPSALRTAIDETRTSGRTPLAVIATAGTTVLAAFDPIDALADICAAEDLWLHVDGCYGGSALFSDAERHRLAGVERSDSFVWNLHKMMGITQQCTALLVADASRLRACFATGADYLFQPDKLFGEYDSGDSHFQCARRVDALKLWLTWHAHGDDGFGRRVDHAVAMADHLRARIEASGGEFAVVAPGNFTNVVFVWVPPRLRPFELATLSEEDRAAVHGLAPAIKADMQRSGAAMIGFQPVNGLNAFRWLFMNPAVDTVDIDETLDIMAAYGRASWERLGRAAKPDPADRQR